MINFNKCPGVINICPGLETDCPCMGIIIAANLLNLMEQPTDNHIIVIINDSNKKIIMGTDIVQTSITYTFMIVTDAENMA